LNRVGGVGKCVLLDEVPTLADAERCWTDSDPPRQLETTRYLADGGVDDLELISIAEPGAEDVRNFVPTVPL
jgi:hypothetical protein